MYGILAYIWAILVVNVGKYSIHGASGPWARDFPQFLHFLLIFSYDFLILIMAFPACHL